MRWRGATRLLPRRRARLLRESLLTWKRALLRTLPQLCLRRGSGFCVSASRQGERADALRIRGLGGGSRSSCALASTLRELREHGAARHEHSDGGAARASPRTRRLGRRRFSAGHVSTGAVRLLAARVATLQLVHKAALRADACAALRLCREDRRGHRRSASTPVEELAGEFYRDISGGGMRDRVGGIGGGGGGAGGAGGEGALGGLGADSGLGDADTSEQMMLDPKRAKRILANRLSAARSKERKQRHAQELEHRASELEAELAVTGNAAAQVEHQVQLLIRERKDLEAHLEALERHKAAHDSAHQGGGLEHAPQAGNTAWPQQ